MISLRCRWWIEFVSTVFSFATLLTPAVARSAEEQSQSSTLRSESTLALVSDVVQIRVSYSQKTKPLIQIANLSDYPVSFFANSSEEKYVGPHTTVTMFCAEGLLANGSVRVMDANAEFESYVEAKCGDLIEIVGRRVYEQSQEFSALDSEAANSRMQIAAATDDLYFDGSVSYSISGGTVHMIADGICNGRNGGTSGTLYWRIRFTQQSTPVGDGYTGGEIRLDPLQGGYCYRNLDRTISFTQPPAGVYYVHFTLYEYPETNTIVDSRTFSNTVTFATGSGGTGSGNDTGGFHFDGTVAYTISNGTVRMRADGICNGYASGTSGTLYWRVRLTTQATPAGDGYYGGEVRLDPLQAGNCYRNLDQTVSYSAPPAGTYHVHFTLYEYPELSTIVASRTFSDTITVSNNTGSGGSGGGSGDGGGGGGTIGEIELAMLISGSLLMMLRRRLRTRHRNSGFHAC